MTSRDLAQTLATTHGLSVIEARRIVAKLLDAIVAGSAKGEVALSGFGKSKATDRPARQARNPRTSETMIIAPQRQVAFRPAKGFKDRLQR